MEKFKMTEKKDTYIYRIGENIYINLTNRCSNNCDFCIRNHSDGIDEYYLWLQREPDADEIISLLANEDCKEIVFCGFGEPLMRSDAVLKIAAYAKGRGIKTRVNTNGQAQLFLDEDVTKQLCQVIDTFNVSLNATDAKTYQQICHSVYGEASYDALLRFARECKENGREVVLSVVDTIGKSEIEKAQRIADELGVKLRVREFIA